VGNRIGGINGVAMAYIIGLVNAGLALVISFGVTLTEGQQAGIVGFVNAGLILVAHVSYNQAKHTKTVIPAPPIDESHPQG
jgi:hypothetical protein